MAQSDRPSRFRDQHRSVSSVGGLGASRKLRVSKAMSWLLRHGAQKEGIPIDEQGYVSIADMLKWHKMRKELTVSFEEVLEEVQSNNKQRFALLYVPPEAVSSKRQTEDKSHKTRTGMGREFTPQDVDNQSDIAQRSSSAAAEEEEEEEEEEVEEGAAASQTATAIALESAFATSDPDPSHYRIRATQGHSIKTVSASAYLTPITLENPASTPETVVHGTFYAAWESILRSGGLKPMGRVHVHFAAGPRLDNVLGAGGGEAVQAGTRDGKGVFLGDEKAVISGMGPDAQILIYINIRKALEMGIPFWKSENGVVLSEGGVSLSVEGKAKNKNKNKNKTEMEMKIVPTECWDVVVEVKEGLGVIWRDGEALKDLPEHLKKMGWPHRKEPKGAGVNGGAGTGAGAGGRTNVVNGSGGKKSKGKGGSGKRKFTVERDDLG